MTRAGKPVQVTDHSKPRILQRATPRVDEEERKREIEEALGEVLRGQKSSIPLSKIVLGFEAMRADGDTSFLVRLITDERGSEAAMAESRGLDFPPLFFL